MVRAAGPGRKGRLFFLYSRGLGFSVYDVINADSNTVVNSQRPVHLAYEHVFDEAWREGSGTTSIAAVKTRNGTYLVALGVKNGGLFGFYTAADPGGGFTFLHASRIPKEGQNASIVTECRSGDLYMLQFGSEGLIYKTDKAYLYKLIMSGGRIQFENISSRKFVCRGQKKDGASNWCSFEAGATAYVTPDNKLVFYAIDKEQSEFGNIRLVQFSSHVGKKTLSMTE